MLGCVAANGLWFGEAAVEGEKVALQNMTRAWPLYQSIGEGIKLLSAILYYFFVLACPSKKFRDDKSTDSESSASLKR